MKYFTIKELTRSATAERNGIDNTPTEAAAENLTALVEDVLDPLREMYGSPIHVNSGYRCPALNEAVGGSPTSQHMTGQAADLDTDSAEGNKKIFGLIEEHFDFDQLIWENGGAWVHVSYKAEGGNRRQVKRLWKK